MNIPENIKIAIEEFGRRYYANNICKDIIKYIEEAKIEE